MKAYNKSNIPHAKALRKNMTRWERKLWYLFLREYPVRFQRQKAIGDYVVDFYCAKAKLIVELDGSGHYINNAKIIKDNIRTENLEKMNLKVLRINNFEVTKNFVGVCDRIDYEVKKLYPKPKQQK